MNLIKHIANILALWTIPFLFVLFFMLATGFAFTYKEFVFSGPFEAFYFIYSLFITFMYVGLNVENVQCNSIKLFKTN